MSTATLAIIGSGKMAKIYAEIARERGIQTISFSNNPNDKVIGHCDTYINLDIFDYDSIIAICKEKQVSGVVSTTELTIAVAAKVSAALGLCGLPAEIAGSITNKAYVRKKAQKAQSIKQPPFLVLNDRNEKAVWDAFPAIVKPTSLGGKRGITVVHDADELDQAIAFAFDSITRDHKEVIIEGFMQGGQEYSVESLSYRGTHKVIQITQKLSSGPPHCVELGHIQPALLDDATADKIRTAIPELLQVLGIDNTATHTEIKVIDGEIYLVEVNTRYGGDGISYPLTGLSTGFGYLSAGISIAMNDFTFPEQITNQQCCGLLYVVQQTAFLKELFDRCESYPWLYQKVQVSDDLIDLCNNDEDGTNHFIFVDHQIPDEIRSLLAAQNLL